MVRALQNSFPPNFISFTAPTGGMFLWITVTDKRFEGVSSEELFIQLAALGVITVPGHVFFVEPATTAPAFASTSSSAALMAPCLRLSYAAPSLENIREGVARLANGLLKI